VVTAATVDRVNGVLPSEDRRADSGGDVLVERAASLLPTGNGVWGAL